MSSMPYSNTKEPAKRLRFSLLTLFWWQVLLVPVFLAPVYAQYDHKSDIWLRFAASILAPVFYSAFFVWWASNADDTRRLPVLAAVRRGAMFGAIFGLLAYGFIWLPLSIRALAQLGWLRYANVRAQPWTVVLWTLSGLGELLAVVCFVLLLFGLFGAATGGVMGLARDLWHPRIAKTLNPEP